MRFINNLAHDLYHTRQNYLYSRYALFNSYRI